VAGDGSIAAEAESCKNTTSDLQAAYHDDTLFVDVGIMADFTDLERVCGDGMSCRAECGAVHSARDSFK
jgi:hypothetical protein